jgi:hypothetical protein
MAALDDIGQNLPADDEAKNLASLALMLIELRHSVQGTASRLGVYVTARHLTSEQIDTARRILRLEVVVRESADQSEARRQIGRIVQLEARLAAIDALDELKRRDVG